MEPTIEQSTEDTRASVLTEPRVVRLMCAEMRPYIDTLVNIAGELCERHVTMLNWARRPDFPQPVLEFGPHSRVYNRLEVRQWVDSRRGRTEEDQ